MKPSLQAKIHAGLSARVILIMITVTATTGGFILGYLVGKKTSSDVNLIAMKQQAADPALQKNEKMPAEAALAQDQVAAQTSAPQSPAAQEQKSPAANETPMQIPAKPSAVQNTEKEKALEPAPNIKPDSKKDATSPPENLNGGSAYFVQVGAFSSQSKAERLKHTLDSKGYKASIRKWSSKKHRMLYKVIAGEFSSKEEAEILALRLKKTEGLSASVNKK